MNLDSLGTQTVDRDRSRMARVLWEAGAADEDERAGAAGGQMLSDDEADFSKAAADDVRSTGAYGGLGWLGRQRRVVGDEAGVSAVGDTHVVGGAAQLRGEYRGRLDRRVRRVQIHASTVQVEVLLVGHHR